MTIHVFSGFDEREAIGFHVFVNSVLEHASVPVAIHGLGARGMPVGSNSFTYSRFLVPWLMGFEGHAIFADASDMLMLGDIAELDALFDPSKAVQVVQHTYKTRHPVKYIGTSMECPNRDYERKNWMSCALINCAHVAWAALTPKAIEDARPLLDLLQLRFIVDEDIGELPPRWNVLADEGGTIEGAALIHWTGGSPCFKHYENAPGADLWRAQRDRMMEVDA